MQGLFRARLYPLSVVGYNGPMPKVVRTARVHMAVTEKTDATVKEIAAALTSKEAKWNPTDVYEAAVEYLATRKDIKESVAKYRAKQPPTPTEQEGG